MKKIAIIYYSSTGNTEQMADAIANGIRSAGASVDQYNVSDITASDAAKYDVLVLGCPAMGAETLEEMEFEPFMAELEGSINGKDVALFGSYGWGDGEWMRNWQDRITDNGGKLMGDGLIINDTPDDDGIAECKDYGSKIAAL